MQPPFHFWSLQQSSFCPTEKPGGLGKSATRWHRGASTSILLAPVGQHMARAKACSRMAPSRVAIGHTQVEATPTMPHAPGMEESHVVRHHDRDHGGMAHRRAVRAVQERIIIVEKWHYVVIEVPTVMYTPLVQMLPLTSH